MVAHIEYTYIYIYKVLCVLRERMRELQNTAGCHNVTEHKHILRKYKGRKSSDKMSINIYISYIEEVNYLHVILHLAKLNHVTADHTTAIHFNTVLTNLMCG